jgi:hypothetical protein
VSATGHGTSISGTLGELRYHAHTVAVLATFKRSPARREKNVGTTVATLTFKPGTVNQFWANFGKPTHVALPVRRGGPRRVYELISCDMQAGRAQFRTPPCAIEEPRR